MNKQDDKTYTLGTREKLGIPGVKETAASQTGRAREGTITGDQNQRARMVDSDSKRGKGLTDE